jgi:hypothetical protein
LDIRAFPSLQDLIFECHPFRIVLLAPFVRGDRIGKNLEIIGVARKVPGIDVNPTVVVGPSLASASAGATTGTPASPF